MECRFRWIAIFERERVGLVRMSIREPRRDSEVDVIGGRLRACIHYDVGIRQLIEAVADVPRDGNDRRNGTTSHVEPSSV
jgi:hypothetical protein